MTNPIFAVKIHGHSSIILRTRTTSSMTTNPPKRKQLLIFAPVSAGGMIPIHHSMKIIQASFREREHPYPRLPHSREQSKRSKSSRNPLVTISSTQQVVYRKGQPTATPTKTLVERLYGNVLLTCCRHSMSILTVRLSPVPLPIGLRIFCVGFLKPIKPTVIPVNTGEHGVVKSSLNISVSCILNCQMRLTRAISRRLGKFLFNTISKIRLWS